MVVVVVVAAAVGLGVAGEVGVGCGAELGNVYTSEEEKPAKYSRSNKNRIADTALC